MPRYLIQRTFSAGLNIPVDEAGAETCAAVIDKKSQHGVLGPFVRDPRQDRNVPHLRRSQPGGHPKQRPEQQPARRQHHRSQGPRPYFYA